MDYLTIHVAVIDSPEFMGASPVVRASWLCLYRYCCGQENGGRVAGGGGWSDRKWQQLCRVTLREVRTATELWSWDGDDLVLCFYPIEIERDLQAKRDAGRIGGRAKTSAKLMAARKNGAANTPKQEPKQTPKQNPSEHPTDRIGGDRIGGEYGQALHDPNDLTVAGNPTREPIAHGLGTWVRWHAKEPDRERENLDELGALVGKYGIKPVQAAAERIANREKRKAWPNEILAEIFHADPDTAAKPTRQQIATMIVEAHGWETCARASYVPPERIRDASGMVCAMIAEGRIYDDVVAKLAPEFSCPLV